MLGLRNFVPYAVAECPHLARNEIAAEGRVEAARGVFFGRGRSSRPPRTGDGAQARGGPGIALPRKVPKQLAEGVS